MIIIFNAIVDIIYFIFLSYLISYFNNPSFMLSSGVLLILTLLISLPILLLIKFMKHRKNFFIISTIYIILIASIFHVFGANILSSFNIKTGTINFTIYIYKILFMFSPLLSIYFLGMHKFFHTNTIAVNYNIGENKKKQLFFIIALRRFIPMLIALLLSIFTQFNVILFTLSFIEFIFNFIFFINFKNVKLKIFS